MTWRALLLSFMVLAPPAAAHELPVASVQLQLQDTHRLSVATKDPLRGGELVAPIGLRFQPDCARTAAPQVERTATAVLRRWQLECSRPLTETRLTVEGLDRQRPEAMLHISRANGDTEYTRVDRLAPGLALAGGKEAVGLDAYFGIGVEHILLGPDHLLFVLGLMLLIAATGRGAGALLATVTAFTVAHSLTLGLATIGDITLPRGAVEAVISLSILLLAVELARLRPGAPPATLTQRFPWLVAFGFGLLHGFGFAGALAEIGLPPDAQWRALLLFNLGVEAGQLGVIALLVLGARLLHATTLLARVTRLATTAIGAVAAFWLLDRLQPVVGL
ncbi:HupE/UreJ family protein [Algiphilus aromaticivorans]|uniref:HupE/UreJ family protein n=1 Tax=Algiphilus aromaticivorans TaxID=382454 RepID=UPI0005C213FA|nr:HupE/UreJ family protein [Algiphilus aromaticivorans]